MRRQEREAARVRILDEQAGRWSKVRAPNIRECSQFVWLNKKGVTD